MTSYYVITKINYAMTEINYVILDEHYVTKGKRSKKNY